MGFTRVALGLGFACASLSSFGQGSASGPSGPGPVTEGDVTQPQAAIPADVGTAAPVADTTGAEVAAPAAANNGAGKSALVEEIVVTAQKREEKLANVPISIQAFSPEALTARNITSQLGLSRAVPSLDVGSQAGFATIFLRGIGTEAFLTADPSIASYVDGVYFPFSPTFVQDFAGVKRVEVLKGPQGTLFGRNATGGAISVTTLSPDFENTQTTIDVTRQRFDDTKLRVYTNVPIATNFAANISAFSDSSSIKLANQLSRSSRASMAY